ncbi:hypothetical protein [Catenulispora sp. GP43]|uniref:hypothetical protein n=1 Tax=Catenulispora sp. GP43 TaxID=3156263 RepID=UPI0035129F10
MSELVSDFLSRDVLGVRVGVLLLILPVILAGIGMNLVSRQGWNHPPDSRYYLPMMSRDMGHSWGDAVRTERSISPSWNLSPWYFADNDPTWQQVRLRFLYPVLSIPFIWLWGLSGGSMAIPVIGTVLFIWAIARVLQRLYGPGVAVIVTGAFSLTVPVNVYTWAGTDTLALGLAAVLVLNLPIDRRIGKANLAWLGVVSVFIALTRQVGVLAPAMAGAGWLWVLVRERQWRNRWLGSLIVTAATTFVMTVISMTAVSANTTGVVGRGQTTYFGILRQFVHYLKIVTEQATTYMWHTDRLLYALLIAAGISVLARFASDATAVFVGAVASTYVITAGVGFSDHMRYEMLMFPAAAVAAGGLVSLAIGGFLPKPVAQTGTEQAPEAAAEAAAAAPPRPRFSLGLAAAVARTAPGRFLGLHLPRGDRWKPHVILSSAVLAVVVWVSLAGSWSSTIAAPASPSFAAAQGGADYAVEPLAKPPAEQTLHILFDQATAMAHDNINLQGALDWAHVMRYQPIAPDEPGWSTRAKDGTALVNPNSMGQDQAMAEAYGRGLSLNSTIKSDTVKILSRQASAYGEDVVFTVQDKSGKVHQGTATTMYPVWSSRDSATVTSLVFDTP